MSDTENKKIFEAASYRLEGEELKQFEKNLAESGMSKGEFLRRIVLAVKADKGRSKWRDR